MLQEKKKGVTVEILVIMKKLTMTTMIMNVCSAALPMVEEVAHAQSGWGYQSWVLQALAPLTPPALSLFLLLLLSPRSFTMT